MKLILGTKLGMSQVFRENGTVVPVTLIQAGPVVVTQVRTSDNDGYAALQVGFGAKKKITRPLAGHLKELGKFRWLKEFRIKGGDFKIDGRDVERGMKIDVSIFQPGDSVKISGISKGKGFQGVVKRHGFHGGPKTHGQKHRLRAPGSIGDTAHQRVMKGKRMAGRMGGEETTVRGIKVVEVDAGNNILAVRGAVPGRLGTLLKIRG